MTAITHLYYSDPRYIALSNYNKKRMNRKRYHLGIPPHLQYMNHTELNRLLQQRGQQFRSTHILPIKLVRAYKRHYTTRMSKRNLAARKIQSAYKKYKTTRDLFSSGELLQGPLRKRLASAYVNYMNKELNRRNAKRKKMTNLGGSLTEQQSRVLGQIRSMPSRGMRLAAYSRAQRPYGLPHGRYP